MLFVRIVGPLAGNVFSLFTKIIESHQKCNQGLRNALGRTFCCHTGDGDGDGNGDGDGDGAKYVYKPNFNFLEMTHTNCSASIRKTA